MKGIMIIDVIPKTCKECKFSIPDWPSLLCLALNKQVGYDTRDENCPIHKI
jgi:hypothetical protein